jgi:hypothetical protein
MHRNTLTLLSFDTDLRSPVRREQITNEKKRLDDERKSILQAMKSLLSTTDDKERAKIVSRQEKANDPLGSLFFNLNRDFESLTIQSKEEEVKKILELLPTDTENSTLTDLRKNLIDFCQTKDLSLLKSTVDRVIDYSGFKEGESVERMRNKVVGRMNDKYFELLTDYPEFQEILYSRPWTSDLNSIEGMDVILFRIDVILFRIANEINLRYLTNNYTAKMESLYQRLSALHNAEMLLQAEKDKVREELPKDLINIVLSYIAPEEVNATFKLALLAAEQELLQLYYLYLLFYENQILKSRQAEKIEATLMPEEPLNNRVISIINETKTNSQIKIILKEYKPLNPSFFENIFANPKLCLASNVIDKLQGAAPEECKDLLVKNRDIWVNYFSHDDCYKNLYFASGVRFDLAKVSFLLKYQTKEMDDIFIRVAEKNESTFTELKLILSENASFYAKNSILTLFRKNIPQFDAELKAKENLIKQINSANAEYKINPEKHYIVKEEFDIKSILIMFMQHRNLLVTSHEQGPSKNSLEQFISSKISTSKLVRLYDDVIACFMRDCPRYFEGLKTEENQANTAHLTTHRGQLFVPHARQNNINRRFWR